MLRAATQLQLPGSHCAPYAILQVTLPELRRHKRAFMRLATNQTFNRPPDAAAARRMFVDYLREQLAQP